MSRGDLLCRKNKTKQNRKQIHNKPAQSKMKKNLPSFSITVANKSQNHCGQYILFLSMEAIGIPWALRI